MPSNSSSSSNTCSTSSNAKQGKRVAILAHDPNSPPVGLAPNDHPCQSAVQIEIVLSEDGRIVEVRSGDDMTLPECPVSPLTYVSDFNCLNNKVGQFQFTYETFRIVPGLTICDIEVEELGFCDCKDFSASLSCSDTVVESSSTPSSTGPEGPGDPPL